MTDCRSKRFVTSPRRVFAGCALLLLLAGCGQPQTGSVLARVGTRNITAEDLAAEVQWYANEERTLPTREVLLDRMITRELAAQKARALGLDQDQDLRRAIDTLLGEKLKQRELKLQLDVPEPEVKAFYEQNTQRYIRPGKCRLAIIHVKVDAKASPEKKQQAEQRIMEARRRAESLLPLTNGFGSLALDYSEDQVSRFKGGDAGWFDEGLPEFRLPKDVVSAGIALPNKGDLSQVITTKEGFFLVTKLDIRERSTVPFEQVRDAIRRQLANEKRRQAEDSFNLNLRAFAPVQTNLQALAQTQYPAPAQANAKDGQPPALPHSQ